MCRQDESIEQRKRVTEQLREACQGRPGSYRHAVNGTLGEPVPPEFSEMLSELDRRTADLPPPVEAPPRRAMPGGLDRMLRVPMNRSMNGGGKR